MKPHVGKLFVLVLLSALCLAGWKQNQQQERVIEAPTGLAVVGGKIIGATAPEDCESELTSAIFKTDGFNQLTLEIQQTAWVDASAITYYCESSRTATTTGVWSRTQTKAVSSGTVTLTDELHTKAVSAAATWPDSWGINYRFMRCKFTCTDGVGGNDDLLVVYARLGNL